MTVEEYRNYKEDWNIPLTEDMEEIERKQKVTIATLAVAEAVYKANTEAINTLKLQIRLLENQMQREWSTTLND